MSSSTSRFHIAMFPWFAMGHITPFLHLSNKLAEKGHSVSFFIPTKTQQHFTALNLYPHLITFIPLTVPQVDGLPPGAETTSDVPLPKGHLLSEAFDLTKKQLEIALHNLKPDFVFYDFAYWIPTLARLLGIKSILFFSASAASCYGVAKLDKRQKFTHNPGDSSMKHPSFVTRDNSSAFKEFDGKISLIDRITTSMRESDALCIRTYREIEGPDVDHLENHYNKPVLLTGPNFPETGDTHLEEIWEKWLGGFEDKSVVYCAFGSECVMEKSQFQELVLGLELSDFPFLARLKPPFGAETVEEALPEGFAERVKGRGVVHGGWVQQQQILGHPSVGCFVSHCGFGSMWESLVSNCQIVLVPHFGDQFINTVFMKKELKVAVDVERREEDGWFTRKSVCEAVKLVMEEGSELGEEVKRNHYKWKDLLLTEGLASSYIDNFIIKLEDILK